MKAFKKLAPQTLAFLLLAGLFWHMNLGSLKSLSLSIQWEFFFAAFFALSLAMVLEGLRWKTFFSEPRLTVSNVFRATAVGKVWNQILPAAGGDFVKPFLLKRISSIPYPNILATCLVERIFDFCFLLGLLLAAALTVFASSSQFHELWIFSLFCALVAISLLAISLALRRHVTRGLADPLKDFSEGLKRLRRKGAASNLFICTLIIWALRVLAMFALFRCFPLGPELSSPNAAAAIVGLSSLALFLPTPWFPFALHVTAAYKTLSEITENSPGVLGSADLFLALGTLFYLANLAPILAIGIPSYFSFPKRSQIDRG